MNTTSTWTHHVTNQLFFTTIALGLALRLLAHHWPGPDSVHEAMEYASIITVNDLNLTQR